MRAARKPSEPIPRLDGGHDDEFGGVRLTHPDRVLYPDQGATKAELARYYETVAPLMLPHLAGRPLMLKRCPAGIGGECFFQKHRSDSTPPSVKTIRIREGSKSREYLAVDDLAGLVALVQMGTLEIHAWGSRLKDVEKPDLLVFDLDPAKDVAWKVVVASAREVRKRLAGLGLRSFVKTSGGKGLHVVVPIQPTVEWPAVKAFCRGVAEALARDRPERYVSTASLAARGGRIFVDYLRNGRGATAVAAYSTRASPRAPIATPVSWDELGRIRPDRFDLSNIRRRLASTPDPWRELLTTRQDLAAAIRALDEQ
jgi:bifunctional non-homologous end joining protein LigD